MKRALHAITFATYLLCACAWVGLSSQLPLAAQAPLARYRVAGVVLSEKTGQPLAYAEVTLTDDLGYRQVGVSFSDAQGRFAFDNLSSGRYAIRASHRGYVPAAFEEHAGMSTAIVVGPGLAPVDVRLTLAPQAVIRGVISDDSGDPVPQARITLYRRDTHGGTGRMVRASGSNADSLGNYEVAQLSPGAYYVCAAGTPWYATSQQPSANASEKASGSQSRSPLDVAYPITCHPGVTDPNAAEPVAVSAGDRVPINLAMHAVPAVRISIQMPAGTPQQGIAIPQLREDFYGMPEAVQTGSVYVHNPDGRDGSANSIVEMAGVAPGQYNVEMRNQAGEMNRAGIDLSSGNTSIDLTSSTTLPAITGKIVMASGRSLPAGLNLSLIPAEGEDPGFARVGEDGGFQLPAVPPGDYEVVVNANEVTLAVLQLKAKGASVHGSVVHVGGDPIVLTAIVNEARASLSGYAQRDGKPASGVFVLLAPADPNAGRTLWQPNQSDSDGSFVFPRVPPGNYTILAIDEGWTLDWTHPEVISRYMAKSIKVTVSPDSKEIHLKEPVEVQPK